MIRCLITARTGSTRLPGKHMLRLGDNCVIEHIVRRCEHFGFDPILCVPHTDVGAFSDVTSCLEVFGGDPDNVEARLIECAHHYDLTIFHHLDGDDPFFDEYAVIDSFNAGAMGVARVTPSYQSETGSGRVGTTYNLQNNAKGERKLADRLDRHVWPQRLTLDYEEDYWLVCAVERMAGGFMAPRYAIDDLFIKNPDLHKINWFRTQEWKEHQRHDKQQSRRRIRAPLREGDPF